MAGRGRPPSKTVLVKATRRYNHMQLGHFEEGEEREILEVYFKQTLEGSKNPPLEEIKKKSEKKEDEELKEEPKKKSKVLSKKKAIWAADENK